MEILLLILKTIGLIILWILLILLAILLIILVTPFRYEVRGHIEGKQITANVKFHFWLRLIAACVNFADKKLEGYLRILFFRKYLIGDRVKKKKKKEDTEENKPSEDMADDALDDLEAGEKADDEPEDVKDSGAEDTPETGDEEPSYAKEDDKSPEETEDESGDDTGDESEGDDESDEPEGVKPGKKAPSPDEALEKVKSIYDKIKGKITSALEKYESAKKKLMKMDRFLHLKCTQHTIKIAVKFVKRALRAVIPKKIKGYARIGLDDPKLMGMICMYGGMFYPLYAKTFTLETVFDDEVVDADFCVKGRIILGELLIYLICVLVQPDLYRTLKAYKRMNRQGGQNGKEQQ